MSDAGRDDKEEQEEQEEKALVLTVRLIRSFEHRNVRHLVVRCARGTDSVGRLMDLVRERARDDGRLPPPFRDFPYDTFKIEHQAHGSKTSDPVINRDGGDGDGDGEAGLISDPSKSLSEVGVADETELSFFRLEDYLRYRENPTHVW